MMYYKNECAHRTVYLVSSIDVQCSSMHIRLT